MINESQLKEWEKLANEATPGPAKKWLDESGHWHIYFPNILRGFGGHRYGWLTYAAEHEVDFDIARRTAVPELIQAVRTLAEALEKIQSQAGNPDAADGCRIIIGTAKSALERVGWSESIS